MFSYGKLVVFRQRRMFVTYSEVVFFLRLSSFWGCLYFKPVFILRLSSFWGPCHFDVVWTKILLWTFFYPKCFWTLNTIDQKNVRSKYFGLKISFWPNKSFVRLWSCDNVQTERKIFEYAHWPRLQIERNLGELVS